MNPRHQSFMKARDFLLIDRNDPANTMGGVNDKIVRTEFRRFLGLAHVARLILKN